MENNFVLYQVNVMFLSLLLCHYKVVKVLFDHLTGQNKQDTMYGSAENDLGMKD